MQTWLVFAQMVTYGGIHEYPPNSTCWLGNWYKQMPTLLAAINDLPTIEYKCIKHQTNIGASNKCINANVTIICVAETAMHSTENANAQLIHQIAMCSMQNYNVYYTELQENYELYYIKSQLCCSMLHTTLHSLFNSQTLQQ